ncbi:MAG: hypothetical protein CMJ48_00305 [Planctomycetaceae bacterium]|nr:hypothetical protein [Planctomycetaceae bacterium]
MDYDMEGLSECVASLCHAILARPEAYVRERGNSEASAVRCLVGLATLASFLCWATIEPQKVFDKQLNEETWSVIACVVESGPLKDLLEVDVMSQELRFNDQVPVSVRSAIGAVACEHHEAID